MSERIDFGLIGTEHVEEACRLVLSSEAPARRQARSTFVEFAGHHLPAKYVLGLAYELATGFSIEPDQYTGGEVAARTLRTLGFKVVRTDRKKSSRAPIPPRPAPRLRLRQDAAALGGPRPAKAGRSGTPQKVASSTSQVGQTRALGVATACISGAPAGNEEENDARIELLRALVAEIRSRQWLPSILLLPGGYFYLPAYVGHRSHEDRVDAISDQEFSRACEEAAGDLHATIIAGVDGSPVREDAGDQLCVAWGSESIIGLGRKVFPAPGETEDLVVYASDLKARTRLACLDDHRQALLCSCYDMFGCTERADHLGARTRNIRRLHTHDLLHRTSDRDQLIAAVVEGLNEWADLVENASVGCAAIHRFTRRGCGSGKAYWQRHGIRKASLVLGGRLAFGAAHLEPPLPQPNVATFAAREGIDMSPDDYFLVDCKKMSALVRLFQPGD